MTHDHPVLKDITDKEAEWAYKTARGIGLPEKYALNLVMWRRASAVDGPSDAELNIGVRVRHERHAAGSEEK